MRVPSLGLLSPLRLRLLWESTEPLWGLVAGLPGVQRVLGEQDGEGRDRAAYGHPRHFLPETLPRLVHGLVAELGHLVQPSHLPLQDLHAGDGLGEAPARPCEDHLPQGSPAAATAALARTLHASRGESQEVSDLAALLHPHVEYVRGKPRDGMGIGVLSALDPPEVALVEFRRTMCWWWWWWWWATWASTQG